MPTTVPLLAGFLAACVIQVAGGVLLLWPRPSGIVVSVVGVLLAAPFWWGFDLPFAWLNAVVVLTFLALAWTAQRDPHVVRAEVVDLPNSDVLLLLAESNLKKYYL